ncbi:MAG: Ureidoglycolate lyase [Modestobacter sp.]|nr:Ureidoglycolate lyase [Modestobacter sp.]
MKLATIRTLDGATRAVRVEDDVLVDVGAVDLGEFLADPAWAHRAAAATEPASEVRGAAFAPVVPRPGKIVCVGPNYRNHILEMGRDLPEYPTLFSKYADTLVGADDDIIKPPESDEFDWECELAVIIGAPARRARGTDAEQAIAGFAILNDVTCRDWQFRTREWLQGENWEATTPLGPYLVTPTSCPGVSGPPQRRGDAPPPAGERTGHELPTPPQVGDVDFLRRRVVVSRQVQRGPGGTVELRAPTHGSERTIVVPDRLLTLIAGHVEQYLANGGPERWLFATPTGAPPHQNTVGHQWRKATSATGVTGLRLHDLRHFFASGLIASGWDVVTVQRALGHASATTTLNTYGHLWPTQRTARGPPQGPDGRRTRQSCGQSADRTTLTSR